MSSKEGSIWDGTASVIGPSPSQESKYFRTVWLRLLMKEWESALARLVDVDNSIFRLEESFRLEEKR